MLIVVPTELPTIIQFFTPTFLNLFAAAGIKSITLAVVAFEVAMLKVIFLCPEVPLPSIVKSVLPKTLNKLPFAAMVLVDEITKFKPAAGFKTIGLVELMLGYPEPFVWPT